MPPRSTRYCRPRKDPPETFLAHLVRRYAYGDAAQWLSFIAEGYAWIERPRPKPPRQQQASLSSPEPSPRCSDGSSMPQNTAVKTKETSTDAILNRPDEELQQGDIIFFNPPRAMEPAVDVTNISVLHADADVVVCVKNGAIPVAEGGRYAQNTLCSVMAERDLDAAVVVPVPGTDDAVGDVVPHAKKRTRGASHSAALFPVHRLDKETSGIVVMARSSEAAAHLADQFHHHADGADETATSMTRRRCEATKEYEAVLEGVLDESWAMSVQAETLDGPNQPGAVRSGVTIRWGDDGTARDWGVNTAPSFVVCIEARIGSVLEAPWAIPTGQAKLAKLRMRTYPPCALLRAKEGAVGPENAAEGGGAERTAGAASEAMDDAVTNQPVVSPSPPSLAAPFGKSARTELTVLAVDTLLRWSLVRVKLFTGRTHQIRVHCAHIGFPVVGDKMYTTTMRGGIGGSCCVDDDLYLRRTRGETDIVYPAGDVAGVASEGCGGCRASSCVVATTAHSRPTTVGGAVVVRRHLLHACRLSFAHPTTAPAINDRRRLGGGEDSAAPYEAPMMTTFEASGEAWFAADVTPVKNVAKTSCAPDVVCGNAEREAHCLYSTNPIHRLYSAAHAVGPRGANVA